jgi:hypothetical protein
MSENEELEKKRKEEAGKQNKRIRQHKAKLREALGLKSDTSEKYEDYEQRRKNDEKIRQMFELMSDRFQELAKDKKPSEIVTEEFKEVLNAYVPEKNQKNFLYILDKRNKFSYSSGMSRRTVRSANERFMHYTTIQRLFDSYYNLSFYADTMADYYNMAEERYALYQLVGHYTAPSLYVEGDMIAAELDAGGTDLAQILEDILMSENNTNVVSTDIIRGIVKSDNTHLHKILGDFLLAARLQEGVRQAICENMDCGTVESFLTLLKVIEDNDLIRFSAIKRAVSTWTGLCDEENMERITAKQLDLMGKALRDREYREELIKSNDNIELYIGLWAQGFYEVEDSMKTCQELIKNGTKNQMLVVSYYNRALQNIKFTMQQAKLMLETHPEDMELCAAYLPTYMSNIWSILWQALLGKQRQQGYVYRSEYIYESVSYDVWFKDEEEARKHFYLLKQLHDAVPKKGHLYSPCIFPWYSVSISKSDGVNGMAMIAYMLQDNELIDIVCQEIPYLPVQERENYLCLLLHEPKTQVQRDALMQALSDKSPDTRSNAFKLIEKMELNEDDYTVLQNLLKYKYADLRVNVLKLLEKRDDDGLYRAIERLVSDKKEEMRLGGIDLVARLKKNDNRQKLYKKSCALLTGIQNPTEKEEVIIRELTGESQADKALESQGYGLYRPQAKMELPEFKTDFSLLKELFHRNTDEFYEICNKLEGLIEKNKNLEYKSHYGEEYLLGEKFIAVGYENGEAQYPFPELWEEFYKKEIKDYKTLFNLHIWTFGYVNATWMKERKSKFAPLAEEIYGKGYSEFDLDKYAHGYMIKMILQVLYNRYSRVEENRALNKSVAKAILSAFLELPIAKTYIARKASEGYGYVEYAIEHDFFKPVVQAAQNWKTEEEFEEAFILQQTVNKFYQKNIMGLTFLDYVQAYTKKMISLDNVYQAAFDSDEVGLSRTFNQLQTVVCYPDTKLASGPSMYLKEGEKFEESEVFKTAIDIYWKIVDMILNVELKRSEVETKFSYAVSSISKIRGVKNLVDILVALGKDILDRSTYYSYRSGSSRRSNLSHLLYVSEPLPGENGETLKKELKGKKITEKRLVEVAMFSSKWIDCIEEYLGWSGLKSGIYYFAAHMNEWFDDRKKAIIAKYTPLSIEDLNNGAFDLDWFKECSQKLGEKNFQMLYDSAKYISDSNKHTRARKYTDAARGKVTVEELEEEINAKRNKDLLMSYPLIPIASEKDALRRYQFLQKFLKESKQFGSQRRASESTAVSMGMQNLATNTGYTDVTRLTLNMETKLVENMKSYFEWQETGEVKLKIEVDENGKPAILCEKNGKMLKSIPAKMKKDEFVLEIKGVCKQLKDQYTRTKAMFEQFMEDSVNFTASELANLQGNPVILPLLRNLVFICDKGTGFIDKKVMRDFAGEEIKLTPKKKLRIAHPFDLWKAGNWHEYQKLLFEKEIKQPFKQVFRELYIKTKEELDRHDSLRYAGNQIQPQKTVACLKGRRWVADYEDGLQKIYYKENIVARIYAMADWFSPSDIEAPTLEWVEFSDRKTFKAIKIQDIPDIVFSEVMRDVDLAVSVAHAGGVDPETSHSTMEMRKMIIEFNLPLFGLTNVTFSGNHAIIEGKRGSYTVHLGSGVIFKRGGAQIAVLPVHSQHRGKMFLPFIDEDPKTAEIMSKIVLFAEDNKIKDPYILEQIM